jgi:hypothetical protein
MCDTMNTYHIMCVVEGFRQNDLSLTIYKIHLSWAVYFGVGMPKCHVHLDASLIRVLTSYVIFSYLSFTTIFRILLFINPRLEVWPAYAHRPLNNICPRWHLQHRTSLLALPVRYLSKHSIRCNEYLITSRVELDRLMVRKDKTMVPCPKGLCTLQEYKLATD